MALKRKIIDFTRDEEEVLIRLVRERPALYDATDENHKNGLYRYKQWTEISDTLLKPVTDCKTRWRSLRDTFKKKKSAGSEKWELFDMLRFIDDKSQRPEAGRSENDENSSLFPKIHEAEGIFPVNESDSNWEDNTDNRQDPLWNMPKYDRQHNFGQNKETDESITSEERNRIIKIVGDREKEHAVELLFRGLAQTVMTFPPKLAAEAKFKVCQVVSELEYRLHNVEFPYSVSVVKNEPQTSDLSP